MTRTLVISDLHLGGASGAAVLERRPAREALFDALAGVERLVLLGDVLELRHGPRRDALLRARPFFEQLGRAFAGREVIVLAGNHDHALIERWRRDRDEDGARGGRGQPTGEPAMGGEAQRTPLALEQRMEAARASSMLASIAEWAAPARVSAAYPGVWLREDVYATHGHYLDCHLSVPTMECLGIGMTARALGKRTSELASMADYEGVTAPVYAWIDAVARQAPTGSALNGQSTVRMWRALGGDRGNAERGGANDGADGASGSTGVAGLAALGPVVRRRALAGAFPVAVAALNRIGLGSFKADISAPELRRAGLRAMGEVAARLGLGEAYVIFGHTHRRGPLPQDPRQEWRGDVGARLINAGCWTFDAYFLRGKPGESPYWPGGAVLVDDDIRPPQLLRLLDGYDAEQLTQGTGRPAQA